MDTEAQEGHQEHGMARRDLEALAGARAAVRRISPEAPEAPETARTPATAAVLRMGGTEDAAGVSGMRMIDQATDMLAVPQVEVEVEVVRARLVAQPAEVAEVVAMLRIPTQ